MMRCTRRASRRVHPPHAAPRLRRRGCAASAQTRARYSARFPVQRPPTFEDTLRLDDKTLSGQASAGSGTKYEKVAMALLTPLPRGSDGPRGGGAPPRNPRTRTATAATANRRGDRRRVKRRSPSRLIKSTPSHLVPTRATGSMRPTRGSLARLPDGSNTSRREGNGTLSSSSSSRPPSHPPHGCIQPRAEAKERKPSGPRQKLTPATSNRRPSPTV